MHPQANALSNQCPAAGFKNISADPLSQLCCLTSQVTVLLNCLGIKLAGKQTSCGLTPRNSGKVKMAYTSHLCADTMSSSDTSREYSHTITLVAEIFTGQFVKHFISVTKYSTFLKISIKFMFILRNQELLHNSFMGTAYIRLKGVVNMHYIKKYQKVTVCTVQGTLQEMTLIV